MWWLITLLVLALVAFFVVKSMKAGTQNRQTENDHLQNEALTASSSAQVASPADPSQDSSESPSITQQAGGVASTAGVAAAAVAAGVAANAAANNGNTADDSSPSSSSSSKSSASVQTGDHLADVREMIKILNLDGPDASRLGISREELTALRKDQSSGIPDAASLENVATKLRQMMA